MSEGYTEYRNGPPVKLNENNEGKEWLKLFTGLVNFNLFKSEFKYTAGYDRHCRQGGTEG